MIRTWKQLRMEYERIPKWYGIAWVNWDVASYTCYPIPLNWIMRYVRELVLLIKYPRRKTLTVKIAIEVNKATEEKIRKRWNEIYTKQSYADAWIRQCKHFKLDPDTLEKLDQMTYRYARDRAMTLLEGGAYIERRSKASPKSKSETQDVYYLVWEQPVDNAGLLRSCERRMWRGTFFTLLEDKVIRPIGFAATGSRWVLNK